MMKIRATSTRLYATLVAAGILGGCTTVGQSVRDAANSDVKQAQDAFKMTQEPARMPRVMDTNDFYVSTKAIRVRDDVGLLPPVFRLPMALTINPRASMRDVAQQVARSASISVSFAHDVEAEASQPTMNAGFQVNSSLKDVLDTIARQNNVSWRYRDGAVEFYRVETRVFQVYAPPGSSEATTTLSNKNSATGGGASQASTNNGQDYKQVSKVDFWGSTEQDIKQMLSPTRGKVVISQSLGAVTVTDIPVVLNSIDAYIKQINFLRSRNISIAVQVYAVETSAGEAFDLRLTAVYEKLGEYGLKLISPTSGVIENSGSVNATVTNANSRFLGSGAFLQALNTVGSASEVDNFSVVTVTGEPAPLNSLVNEGYLAKVSVQQPTFVGGTPTQSLEPGIITYGASGMLTPKLINGTDMQLRVALDLSSKLGLRKVTSTDGGASIQIAETGSRSFANTFNIKTGQTLIIGLQTAQNTFSGSSMMDPDKPSSVFAGGARSSKQTTRTLVFAITPSVTTSN